MTGRCVAIRPVAAADREAFIAAVRASRHLHRPWVTAPGSAAAFDRYLARFDGTHHFGFVAYQPESGQLIGAINVTNAVFGVFRSAYLGYYAFAGYAGRGLMKAALRAVIRHAFGKLKLHRLEANIQPGNTASIALVRRCGFAREGFSPAYLKIGGRWCDHERWAIVRGTKTMSQT